MIDILAKLKTQSVLIDNALHTYFSQSAPIISTLTDAEIYGIMSGGKRVRPFLTLEFSKLFGGNDQKALPFACAVELIHSYSLIHDDLPCMDNDDMRRGKPSCHKKFGEANALLAGDALLTYAFEICASNNAVTSQQASLAVSKLAHAAGTFGMVGGQMIDLYAEKNEINFDTLLTLHSLKTGALIGAAVSLGCISAGVSPYSPEYQNSLEYAKSIGLTFQIVDDILDAEEGSEKAEKTTFLSFMSKEDAYKYAKDLTQKAVNSIKIYPNNETLTAFAEWLLVRKS